MTALLMVILLAQTKIDLPTQAKNPDFSAMAHTRPASVGSSLPGTCAAGEVFFNTAATAGQNLYLCTATNTWTQLTGGLIGSVATATRNLTDFAVSISPSNAAALNIASGCTLTALCNVRWGARTVAVNAAATATAVSGSGIGLIYLSNSGVMTVATTGLTVTCSGCTAISGSQFPSDSIPLFTWSSTTGTAWDTTGGVDVRAFLSNAVILGGTGIIAATTLGETAVSVDSTTVSLRVTVPGSSSATCAEGTWARDTSYRYECVATNTWKRVAIATW